ncbi:unnamed protein product [Moneuplotes crassus]|uniref:Uncharacterized protein n=1 Tax=Euplotes crassus TaxID=5936 RepID=A0AAD1Y7L5_EUPCR|nr:unnamed protein product [Moneuplotes crassus]
MFINLHQFSINLEKPFNSKITIFGDELHPRNRFEGRGLLRNITKSLSKNRDASQNNGRTFSTANFASFSKLAQRAVDSSSKWFSPKTWRYTIGPTFASLFQRI